MCFYIHPSHTEAKIATKNITCYKSVYLDLFDLDNFEGITRKITRSNLNKIVLSTPFYAQQIDYSKSLLKRSKIVKRDEKAIEQGLHSYDNAFSCNASFGNLIVECVIPKGAKYYYSPKNNEYVSNQLLYTKKFKSKGMNVKVNDKKLLIKE